MIEMVMKVKKDSEEDFKKKLKEKNPQIVLLDSYINSRTKIKFRCLKCGNEWKTVPHTLVSGHGCPKCSRKEQSKKTKKSNEQFLKELKSICPNVLPLEEYKNAQTKIKCTCTKCGFEWKTKPNWLLSGHGCAKCAHKSGGEKIRLTNEDFMKKLKEKNIPIVPLEDYELSSKAIRSECKICGYIWKTTPNSILRGIGCPKCNKIFQTSFPEQAIYYYLKQYFPDIINGYRDGFKNSELDIYIPSKKTAIEYDGKKWHENTLNKEIKKYQECKKKKINLIRIREHGLELSDINCDKCFTSYYTAKQDAETLNPLINQLFDYFKINRKANIMDDYYDIQKMFLIDRKNKSLKYLYPKISKEWDYKKNNNISPEMVLPGSVSKYWWKCNKCGFSWQASINSRTNRNTGCPKCGGTIKKDHKEFLKELKKINNSVLPLEEYRGTDRKIRCKCLICNNEWYITPSKLLNNRSCPNCSVKKQIETYLKNKVKKTGSICNNELLMKEWNYRKNSISPELCTPGSKKKVWWKCSKCHHEWEATIYCRYKRNQGCPKCRKKKHIVS